MVGNERKREGGAEAGLALVLVLLVFYLNLLYLEE